MPIIAFILLTCIAIFLVCFMSAGVIYLGWNVGVLAIFPNQGLAEVTLLQAFCLGLLLSFVGEAFRRSRRK